MVLVDGAGGGVLDGEAVLAVQPGQHAAGVRPARERVGHGGGEARQECGLQQDVLGVGVGLRERLAREVVHDAVGRAAALVGEPAPLLQQQHEAGGPARGPLVQRGQQPSREGRRQPPHERARLRRRQPQIGPADLADGAARAQPREDGRRLRAAGDDHAPAVRQLVHRGAHGLVHGRVGRDLVIAVQHEHERRLQPLEELAQRFAHGVARRALRARAAGGAREVVEEARHAAVAGVALVPETVEAPRLEVAHDERGLAGARRSPHPRERPAGVEQAEQARARQHPANARPGELGEGHRRRQGFGSRTPGRGSRAMTEPT